ncbi:hypothetical protein J6590_065001 [Homalodisca vitripennis]|nr:hypothetical protein J6590_065001 [Homalodisca vitripennis]
MSVSITPPHVSANEMAQLDSEGKNNYSALSDILAAIIPPPPHISTLNGLTRQLRTRRTTVLPAIYLAAIIPSPHISAHQLAKKECRGRE